MKKLLQNLCLVVVLASAWSHGHAMEDKPQALSPKSYRALMDDAADAFSSGDYNIFDELAAYDGAAEKANGAQTKKTQPKQKSQPKSQPRKHTSRRKQKNDQKDSTDNNQEYAQGLIEYHLKDCRKDPKKLVKALQTIYKEAGGEKRIFKDQDFIKDFHTWLAVLDVNNIRNKDDETPLHVAARKGADWVCKILLGVCAKVDAVDAKGEIPLHKAGVNGHKSTCKLLLRACLSLSGARSIMLANGARKAVLDDCALQVLDELELSMGI